MNINHFSFYKILKNEDANPYVRIGENKGFIAAADGLGGSGSFVHQLRSCEYMTLSNRLKPIFLSEYFPCMSFINYKNNDYCNKMQARDEHFESWIEELVKPMIDNEPDTSALWGSRIVIARFVHYLLSRYGDLDFNNEQIRQSIVDYIYKGLKDTTGDFHLESGTIQGQTTLPTTLVGLRYIIDSDNMVHVDVVWAGDSRAYALVPNEGLKQLSVDDEDGSGAINNLFCIKKEDAVNTKLNHASFILPPKSSVFVCSDGLFDPYDPIDNIGMEAAFLNCLLRSTSFDELKQNWCNHYEPMMHDDCTVAFLAFDFESFDEFKSMFKSRADEVTGVSNDYYQYKKMIPIIEGSQENPDEYIIERAKQRKLEIAQLIAHEITINPKSTDVAVQPVFFDMHKNLQRRQEQSFEKRKYEAEINICKDIKKSLIDGYYEISNIICLNDSIANSFFAPKIRSLLNLATTLKDKKSEREKIPAMKEVAERDINYAKTQGDKLKALLDSRQTEIKDTLSLYEEHCREAEKNYKKMIEWYGGQNNKSNEHKMGINCCIDQKNIQDYLKTFDDLKEFWNKKHITKGYKFVGFPVDEHFMTDTENNILKYHQAVEQLRIYENMISELNKKHTAILKEYQAKIQSLDGILQAMLKEPSLYFSETICRKYGLPLSILPEPMSDDTLASEIISYFDRHESIFNDIIQRFMCSEMPSVIDSIFNASRLRVCREYKIVDVDLIKALIASINKLKNDYEDVSSISLVCVNQDQQVNDKNNANKK